MDKPMTAESVMDPHPTVLKPTDTIKRAAGYIMRNRYRSLPVIDDKGRYLGMFGINCLLRLILPKAAIMEAGLDTIGFVHETLHDLHERLMAVEDKPISICMHEGTPVRKVSPDTPLVETLLVLYRTRVSIPVVQPTTGILVGMISYFDVGEKVLSA